MTTAEGISVIVGPGGVGRRSHRDRSQAEMNIKKAVGAAALAVTVVGTGSAWALSQSGNQRFVLHSAGSTFDLQNKVVASGAISGLGYERVVDDRSDKDHQDFTTEYVFPRGTITAEIRGSETTDVNPVSCAGTVKGTIHWTITGGTEAYAGAHGSGTGSYVDRFVLERGPDGCQEDQPVANVFTARLGGTASV